MGFFDKPAKQQIADLHRDAQAKADLAKNTNNARQAERLRAQATRNMRVAARIRREAGDR